MSQINFFSEDISYNLPNKGKTRDWIKKIVRKEGVSIRELNFIFCSDPYLRQLNKEYLQHDYFTDIVTFDNSEEEGFLEGDLFISLDRITENSQDFAVPVDHELRRVIIHGVLHLIGYGDKSESEQARMRQKEDEALSLYAILNQS
jgi:probable rRNA maturation factor